MITSLLDNDLYKFTQQQIVWALYPDVNVTYKFINRRKTDKFNEKFLEKLKHEILVLSQIGFKQDEIDYLRKLPYMNKNYVDWLSDYKFNVDELDIKLENGDLDILISGDWATTILWEVPLMALISEVFFTTVRTDWTMDGQLEKAAEKGRLLFEQNTTFDNVVLSDLRLHWADFGTRRRRSNLVQETVVNEMQFYRNVGFAGTSNVYYAKDLNLPPIGTVAHEWTMAHSVLSSLKHANYFALKTWADYYQGQLGIALTDTYGAKAFFEDFNGYYARLYDGLRWDSGSWKDWTDNAVKHYQKLSINPAHKKLLYTDGLDTKTTIEISKYTNSLFSIPMFAGIGTHLTNDFTDPALNMVIKLNSVNGTPVVKLSDVPSKASGDPKAIEFAKWTFGIKE